MAYSLNDLLLHNPICDSIFGQMSFPSLLECSRVCKEWREIIGSLAKRGGNSRAKLVFSHFEVENPFEKVFLGEDGYFRNGIELMRQQDERKLILLDKRNEVLSN